MISRNEFLLIVAPSAILEEIPLRCRKRFLVISKLAEFEALTHGAESAKPLAAAVDILLHEIGFRKDRANPLILQALAALRGMKKVPSLPAIIPHGKSRRTFYRHWSEVIHDTPRSFLAKGRLLHALALIAGGRSSKEAAEVAGYPSVHQFYRHRSKLARND